MKAKAILALAFCFAAVTLFAPATAEAEFGKDSSAAKPLTRKLRAEDEAVEDAGTHLVQDPSAAVMHDLETSRSLQHHKSKRSHPYPNGYYDAVYFYFYAKYYSVHKYFNKHGGYYCYKYKHYYIYYVDYKCYYYGPKYYSHGRYRYKYKKCYYLYKKC